MRRLSALPWASSCRGACSSSWEASTDMGGNAYAQLAAPWSCLPGPPCHFPISPSCFPGWYSLPHLSIGVFSPNHRSLLSLFSYVRNLRIRFPFILMEVNIQKKIICRFTMMCATVPLKENVVDHTNVQHFKCFDKILHTHM